MAVTPPQSLLDRLIDDAPDAASEPMLAGEAAFDRFKAGLRRDLEGLLNARQPFPRWPERIEGIAGTIVDFGLPDLSTEDFATPAVRERVRRLIAACIRQHEPRLTNVEVESDGAPTAAGVRFRISAMIAFAAQAEEVVYDARLRPTDRVIDVALAG